MLRPWVSFPPFLSFPPLTVIPAQAGIQAYFVPSCLARVPHRLRWVPCVAYVPVRHEIPSREGTKGCVFPARPVRPEPVEG